MQSKWVKKSDNVQVKAGDEATVYVVRQPGPSGMDLFVVYSELDGKKYRLRGQNRKESGAKRDADTWFKCFHDPGCSAIMSKWVPFRGVIGEGEENVKGCSSLSAMRHELLGEGVFSLGSSGLTPVATGKMPMTVGVRYPMGASSSPGVVLLTRVTKDTLYYKEYPWTKGTPERVIDRRIGEDLIYKGSQTYLKLGYKDDLSKSVRVMLRGGKGKKENLAEFEPVVFLLVAADGKDDGRFRLWRQAEQYGSVGGMEHPETGEVYYEVRATMKELKAAQRDKSFRVVKIKKGNKRIGLPEEDARGVFQDVEVEYEFSHSLEESAKRYVRYKVEKSDVPGRPGYLAKVYKPDGSYETTFGKTKKQVERDARVLMGFDECVDVDGFEKDESCDSGRLDVLGEMRTELLGGDGQCGSIRWSEEGFFESFGATEFSQHARLSKLKPVDYKRSSGAAAKKLESIFKDMGFKVSVLSTDGWGQTPLVVEMYGIRVPVQVGVQETPKHGVEVYVQFQSPMFGGGDVWKKISPVISAAMKKTMFRFSKFGSVSMPKNQRGWPTIWTKLDRNQVERGVRGFSDLVHVVGQAIVMGLLGIESDLDSTDESIELSDGVELDEGGLEGAENALRDLFLSRHYKGEVPVDDVKKVLGSTRWRKVYGKGNLSKAWSGLVNDGYVKKSGGSWVWEDVDGGDVWAD